VLLAAARDADAFTEAVAAYRHSLALLRPTEGDQWRVAGNLGLCLLERFRQTAEPDDLADALAS